MRCELDKIIFMWELFVGPATGGLIALATVVITHRLQQSGSRKDRHSENQVELGHRYLAASLTVGKLNTGRGSAEELSALQHQAIEALFAVETALARVDQSNRDARYTGLLEHKRKELWEIMGVILHLVFRRVSGPPETLRLKSDEGKMDLGIVTYQLMTEGQGVLISAAEKPPKIRYRGPFKWFRRSTPVGR